MNPYYMQQVERVLRSAPRQDDDADRTACSDDVVDMILYGTDHEQTFAYDVAQRQDVGVRASFEGVVNNLQRRYSETSSDYVKEDIEKFMSASIVPGLQRRAAKTGGAGGYRRRQEHRRADAHVDREAARSFSPSSR